MMNILPLFVGGLGGWEILLLLVLFLLGLGLWLYALIDVLRSQFRNDSDKIIWAAPPPGVGSYILAVSRSHHVSGCWPK